MKRSEAILSLSEKLQKSQNLLDGYKNGSITLKCLCDNLATRAIDYCDKEISMLPPKACIERSVRVGDEERTAYHNTHEWEPEDEEN
jgi:hypothetical protein